MNRTEKGVHGDGPPRHYDVFLSHNSADKEWTSALAVRLAETEYNGRRLRPWLDREYIDPGKLASDAELTTALDRARMLALVLSPEALASTWVELELRYFIERRTSTELVLLLRRDCEVPRTLCGLPVLDFRSEKDFSTRFDELVRTLCPATPDDRDAVRERVDEAINKTLENDPGEQRPTPERDAVLEALVRYDIDDGRLEGLAIAAFERAAEAVIALQHGPYDRAYNTKMLLGECVAAALVRSAGYGRVVQRLLELAEARQAPSLLFVVVRAFSKLAEIDPKLIDAGALLRLAQQLDRATPVTPEHKATEGLLGRVVGKLRNTPAGDLLIKRLVEGGRSSRISGIMGISFSYHRGGPRFFVSELERAHQRADAEVELYRDAPTKRMLALLFAADLDQHADVTHALSLAKADIQQDFPGTDFPYAYSWFGLRPPIAVKHTNLIPFMGTVVKATRENELATGTASNLGSTVAVLTEPRMIEALFQNCGALLIPEQPADSHQCRRLRGRGVPFAMLSAETMALLADGDVVVVDHDGLSIWSRTHEPSWPVGGPRKRTRPAV